MDNKSFLQSAIGEIGDFYLWLQKKMSDTQTRRNTLVDLGLDPDKDIELQIPENAISNIDQYRKAVDPDQVAFQSVLRDVKAVYASTKEFITALLDDPKDKEIYIRQFLEVTATNYIRQNKPAYYWVFQLLGFLVESKVVIKTSFEDQGVPEILYNSVTSTSSFISENIWHFLTNPIGYFKKIPEKVLALQNKIVEPNLGGSHLDTIEDAENLSELFVIVAALFHLIQDESSENNYLYGWSALPRKFPESSNEVLKNSFLGNIFLTKIRKQYAEEFPIDELNSKAWEKIDQVLAKSEPLLLDIEKKVITTYKQAVKKWERGNWSDLVSERAFSFDLKFPQKEESETEKRLGGTMFLVSDDEVTEHFNTDSDIQRNDTGGLFVSLNGEANYTYQINKDWEFKIETSSGSLLNFYLSNHPDAGILGDMNIKASLKRKVDPVTGASFNLPNDSGTRLAIGEIQVTTFLNKEDYGLEIGLKNNALIISGGEGDSFLNEILPSSDVPLKFSIATGFSKKKGFYIDHNVDALKDLLGSSQGNENQSSPISSITKSNISASTSTNVEGVVANNENEEKNPYELLIPIHKNTGIINFDSIHWDYGPTKKKNALGAYLKVLSTFTSKLGPVMVKVEKIGMGIEIATPNQEADFQEVEFSNGFIFPKGIGLRIDSEIISGGGFLNLDHENHRYAGILSLKLSLGDESIDLTAIGLVNTRLPNSESGYSMLVSISTYFTPGYQLAFGFTLNAVGGLLGIHRTMKVDILQDRVRNGGIRSVMFPENVVENASRIISDLRSIFPVEKDHYVVAPFFRIGYATPTVLEVDLGILTELPFAGRLILLGSLSVYLPNKEHDKRLGEIHVDLFGDFNFAASYILLEGRLRDSQLVGIPFSGGFAFVLDWGSSPQFLISVGGYHPRYKKPARFPAIPRVNALIRKGDAIRLSCEYYQAITSNSFQIGFSAELVIKKGGAIAYGFLGVNSLLQFEPFYFETDVRINVKIVYLGRTFMGIDLAFLLSGPQPWNAQGYAKIKLLFFSLKIKFNYSWGGTQEAVPALIASDLLLEKLKLQLLGTSNWSGKLPVHYIQSASLRSLEASEQQDQIFLHPAGYLEVRQNLIPLSRTIAKLGNSYLTSRTSYQITEYVIGNGAPVSTSSQKPLLGYFSRGQFETLTDDQKLSTADFDLMMSGIQMVPEQVYDISQELESVDNEFETFILDIEEDNLFTDSYNWQKNKLMNITAGRRPIQKSRQAELYGVLEEMPEELGKSYKIMSKATLEPIEDLAGKYFSSQSGALSYLESNLSQETKNSWQVVEALALEFEEALI